MGRILLLVFLGGLGFWAMQSAARGPSAVQFSDSRTVGERPTRAYYVPIYVPPPRSNRTGSTRGPRVGGGGPSFGK